MSRLLRRATPLLTLLAILAPGACYRGVDVGSEPRQTYSVQVRNETGTAMIVSYNDGRGDAILGTVQPGGSERFIIAAPAATTVTLRGAATSGGRTSGPYTVGLTAGGTATVVLR